MVQIGNRSPVDTRHRRIRQRNVRPPSLWLETGNYTIYAMAAVTGWGRVRADAHYWHDILGGAAISALFTWIIVDKYDTSQNITFATSPDDIHVGFKIKF